MPQDSLVEIEVAPRGQQHQDRKCLHKDCNIINVRNACLKHVMDQYLYRLNCADSALGI